MFPGDDALSRLSQVAHDLQLKETEVVLARQHLERLEEERRVMAEEIIPSIMQELYISDLTMSNGAKVLLKKQYYASISKERAHDACEWLRENGYGAIVKNEVIVAFGKGEDILASGAVEALIEAGYQPQHKETVHPQTLKTFVKEMMEGGKLLPYDLLGAGVKEVATIQIK